MKKQYDYPVKPGKLEQRLKFMQNCMNGLVEYKNGKSTHVRAQDAIQFLKDHCTQLYKIINGLEDEDTPEYLAGYDCAVNGANETNCAIKLFTSTEKTKLWEKGKADGDKIKTQTKKTTHNDQ